MYVYTSVVVGTYSRNLVYAHQVYILQQQHMHTKSTYYSNKTQRKSTDACYQYR